MSGEISETAGMTPAGNAKGDGPGMNDGIPPAEDAKQAAQGKPQPYPHDDDSEQPRGE